ncbi:hypothetical protein CON64_01875 [Bacillus pseudomycoides]|nr:hypothetical protein CON64_01875 [Bacillus pseudomycoides]
MLSHFVLPCMWQERELTASMYGQMLSPTEKEWFYVGFLIWIYKEGSFYDEIVLLLSGGRILHLF